ncbi:GNAT family N-acetyltransferase [Paenibacillus sp. YPG26]|uniref:GNAT family N-acetyltransferase n=1 Tax=Paenibacillus sp. YPG26 TaxID=2878915 RepID=UPI00203FC8AF|nr:GNAT family N-acetyltransferase [Paenibacillus sp. YPG26]USB33123.1 GNAT family N-acetyltransferase [Paenibacillus sp. YPG26]
MGFLQITKDNIADEHLCCALGAKSYENAVGEKKKWISERMSEGLVFYRLDERAKVFIEYLPAESAWVPVEAPNYMYINCLWVSGRYKNHGYARQLLNYCKEDALSRGMDGIVHIVGKKNYPYLSDKRFFEHVGFKIMDQAEPYFQLAVWRWNERAVIPFFANQAIRSPEREGVCIYYTAQCPFAVGMVEELGQAAEDQGVPFQAHRINTKEEARTAPLVWTTFGLFYNGKFITHEIWSGNKFSQFLMKKRSEA